MSRNDLGRTVLLLILLPVSVIAQVQRDLAPLTPWPAPLYWQATQTENHVRAEKLDGLGFGIAAATPASALVFVGMTPCRVADTRTGSGFTGAFGPPSWAAERAGPSPYNPAARARFRRSLKRIHSTSQSSRRGSWISSRFGRRDSRGRMPRR